MDYNLGSTYGYDQVSPNMFGDGYDAPYTPSASIGSEISPKCANTNGHRTMLPPPNYNTKRPIASFAETDSRPRVPMDSAVIGAPGHRQTESFYGGERDRFALPSRFAMSAAEVNCMLMLFILVLIIVVIINNINLRHLSKQVKLLTKQGLTVSK